MVCIAGYDEMKNCLRPTLPPPGIPETLLCSEGKPLIFPFAIVEMDLFHPRPQPPHTEDIDFDPKTIRFIRRIEDRESVLKWSLFGNVKEIFEQPILTGPGFYVVDCQGPRSLGTICPKYIFEVIYGSDTKSGAWYYKIAFRDRDDQIYRLKITDLTWNYYCGHLCSAENKEPAEIAEDFTQTLKRSRVYLRIGLSRGWKEYPDHCFLQINGIYTFPDYLEGRTFQELISKN
jgi:hypothetical protein